MIVTQLWAEWIDGFLASQQAAGYPLTTRTTRRQHLQHLARRIGVEPDILTADEFVQWAAEQDWSPSTRRSRRTTFQSFFRWAKETRRRRGNPSKALKKVKQPTPMPRPIPNRIYHEALMRADEDERIWMQLGYDYGMRRTEVALVHSRDLFEDLLGWSLMVHGKGNKDRPIPLAPAMARTLLDRGDGWLVDGDTAAGHISPWWVGRRVARLLEGEWTMHSLRHNAGTRWNRHGGLLVAQRLLGHASVATTQVYCAVDDDELRATVLASAS